ncbi:DUF1566 domain-containing protein [Alcaligenaceae bacterium]|nr:DUF1566 domain-containing protein [Alcaligenaceae bacterium]
MDTIQFELGGGASIALPADKVASALFERLQQQHPAQPTRYKIGEYLHGQGGIYAGDIQGDDGVLYGLAIGKEQDIGKAKWGPDGERDLSEWDGPGNTNRLNRADHPAAYLAAQYEVDGHMDFYLPARREFLIAMANVPKLFGKDSYYWTSTPIGSSSAWAVAFESGLVSLLNRSYEFRVRPFRRFTY